MISFSERFAQMLSRLGLSSEEYNEINVQHSGHVVAALRDGKNWKAYLAEIGGDLSKAPIVGGVIGLLVEDPKNRTPYD